MTTGWKGVDFREGFLKEVALELSLGGQLIIGEHISKGVTKRA